MKRLFFLILLQLCFLDTCFGWEKIDYTSADSLWVVTLLKQVRQLKPGYNTMLYFARQLCGVPYVVKTLEKNKEERLVVNLRELDCTTYVETVLALAACAHDGSVKFEDYCKKLRLIRYKRGDVQYSSRLHYFTSWIDSNTLSGLVCEVTGSGKPFTGRKRLNINFMSTHCELYPMMNGKTEIINEIKNIERKLSLRTISYIPKQSIVDTPLLRKTIKDGDIIVITTSKKGLDSSHIGIAVWHSDGLHLLNASQVRHMVVEEPMTLGVYMAKHSTQTGVRVVRVKL